MRPRSGREPGRRRDRPTRYLRIGWGPSSRRWIGLARECQLSGVIPVCMIRPARGSWPYRSGPRAPADRRHRRPAVPEQAPVDQRGDAADGPASGVPVLVEFWDFCRVNSLRTLPYVAAWHERYAADGLRVIGVHSRAASRRRDDADAVRAAVARLGIEHPVVDRRRARAVDALRQPRLARALPVRTSRARLHDYHYGEGAYDETERAIQELLGVEREPLAPAAARGRARRAARGADRRTRPARTPGPTRRAGCGPCLDGDGRAARQRRASSPVDAPRRLPLVEHERHTAGVLELEVGEGVTCHATCFTPGVAPESAG